MAVRVSRRGFIRNDKTVEIGQCRQSCRNIVMEIEFRRFRNVKGDLEVVERDVLGYVACRGFIGKGNEIVGVDCRFRPDIAIGNVEIQDISVEGQSGSGLSRNGALRFPVVNDPVVSSPSSSTSVYDTVAPSTRMSFTYSPIFAPPENGRVALGSRFSSSDRREFASGIRNTFRKILLLSRPDGYLVESRNDHEKGVSG